MSITVEKKVNNGGTFYDIDIDGVKIFGCKRITGIGAKGDYDFIAMPQRKAVIQGADKYFPVVSLNKERAVEVLQAVKDAEGEQDSYNPQGDIDPFASPDLEAF